MGSKVSMYFENFDLLFTIIPAFAIFFLGIVIYFHDKRSASNIVFFLVGLVTLLWSIVNFFSVKTVDYDLMLRLIRLDLFFAAPHLALFVIFLYIFPSKKINNFRALMIVALVAVVIMALTLTPYIFESLTILNANKLPNPGKLMPIFAIYVLICLVSGMFIGIKKYLIFPKSERKKIKFLLLGFIISYVLIILTKFFAVVFLKNSSFVILGPILMMPLIFGMSYAIIKHQLMNVKVVATEILIFIVLSLSLFEIFSSDGVDEIIIRIIGFLLLFLFSIFLVRSVLNEVQQKEDLQKISTQLKQANKKLKKLDEAKTEFLSITSHQLRTPLSSIKGYLSMMIEGDFGNFDKQQSDALNRVYGEVERLIRLVQVFLNVSRIESGRLRVARIAFDMNKLLDDVVKQLSTLAEEKNISLTYDSGDTALEYVGDSDKLKDVFVNLVDNAIKYTPKGKIWVTAEKNTTHFKVEVHDTGVGIEPEYAEHLFQKFSRAKGIAQINAGGSGLGLFIVKKIIEAHGGTIQARSQGKGKGTTFTVMLPLNIPEEEKVPVVTDEAKS